MDKFSPTWDLQKLYLDYDDPRLQKDMETCKREFEKLHQRLRLISSDDRIGLETFLNDYDQTSLAFSEPDTYVLLRNKTEPESAASALIQSETDRIRQLQQDIQSRLFKLLQNLPDIEGLVKSCPFLAPYRFLLEENQRLFLHRPSPDLAAAIRAIQTTGGYGWLNLHSTLDSSAQVTVPGPDGGRRMPLSEARGLASSPDAAIRKSAYLAELSTYPLYEVPMAACLNGIKGEALAELPFKHYDSVHQEMLDINKMPAEALESMTAAIEEHLDDMRQCLKAKALYLGHKNGLPWYDLLAPLGSSQNRFSYDQAHDMLVSAFSGFSEEMGAFIDQAFQNRWIDAIPASGRQSGGICIDLPVRKECRVLVNYNGSLKDMRMIAHELGHAYHFRCLDHLPLLLRDAPTPICETASIMNETIFHQKCLEMSDKDSLLYLLDADLSEELQTIMDIYSRYLFEKEVFRLRKDRDLLPGDYCRLMTDAQKYVFGDALDPRFLHPYMWMNKVHYYIPEFHYYNYPYIFGLLFSKGLYSRYLQDTSGFPEKYKDLLSYTCSGSLQDIAAKAGIDITSRQFWNDSLDIISGEIEQFSALL